MKQKLYIKNVGWIQNTITKSYPFHNQKSNPQKNEIQNNRIPPNNISKNSGSKTAFHASKHQESL
jgi:hypothetical protein